MLLEHPLTSPPYLRCKSRLLCSCFHPPQHQQDSSLTPHIFGHLALFHFLFVLPASNSPVSPLRHSQLIDLPDPSTPQDASPVPTTARSLRLHQTHPWLPIQSVLPCQLTHEATMDPPTF